MSTGKTKSGRRGVALLVVLGFVALLSLLIAAMMGALRVRLVEGERRDQRASLRVDAESALAVTQGRLAVFESTPSGFLLNTADLERIALDPFAGWSPSDGATVTVRLRDESGLFPINTTDTQALQNLFQDVGLDAGRASALADCLADWIDSDDSARPQGAEADAYGVAGLPANRPLRSFAELRRVKGFDEVFFEADGTPNALGKELAAVVTFLDPGTGPDINGAPESVLRLLATRTGADVSAILALREPLDYPIERKHPGVLGSAGELVRIKAPEGLSNRVTFGSRSIRAIITVNKGDLRYVLDALLAPGSGSSPVRVLRRADESLLADDSGEFAEGSSAETP